MPQQVASSNDCGGFATLFLARTILSSFTRNDVIQRDEAFQPFTITGADGNMARPAIFARILYMLMAEHGESFGDAARAAAQDLCKSSGISWSYVLDQTGNGQEQANLVYLKDLSPQ